MPSFLWKSMPPFGGRGMTEECFLCSFIFNQCPSLLTLRHADLLALWLLMLCRGGKKRKVELFCGSAFCSVPPLPHFHVVFFFPFFFNFFLEPDCQEKEEKKGSKGEKNQQRGSIRSSGVYEASFKAFFFWGGKSI